MVYRGKPSAACGACRKRRSRCDQTTPACGQCVKAGRTCPGYRNTMDLMFHDESTQVASRHKGTDATSHHEKRTNMIRTESLKKEAAVMLPIKLTDFVLYQPIDDLGLHFFMSTYVGDNPAVSQLYYLPQLYSQKGLASPELRQSLKAAGLAGYAKSVKRKEILAIATKAYIDAIRGINSALSHPTSPAKDTTLAAIILAAMYEMMIAPKQTGMKNCSKHLAGAVTVAVMIARQEEISEVTWKLLSTLAQSVIINAWVQQESLPLGFDELSRRIEGLGYTNGAHGQFLALLAHLVNFRHELQTGFYDSPQAIIAKSLSIDHNLRKFLKNMPLEARFEVHRLSSHETRCLAFEGYYHVYPHNFTAHLWNNVRTSRLRLHQVIIKQLEILRSSRHPGYFESVHPQQHQSVYEIRMIAKDILATVPQLTGYTRFLESFLQAPTTKNTGCNTNVIELIPHHKRRSDVHKTCSPKDESPSTQMPTPESTPSPPSSSGPESASDDAPYTPIIAPQHSSLYHILFNLYALRSVTCLPKAMKSWIDGRIDWIESTADPQDITRLQEMMRTRPGDGYPVGADEGYMKYMPKRRAHTGDRTVWLSVFNWFSKGWEKLGAEGSNNEWWK